MQHRDPLGLGGAREGGESALGRGDRGAGILLVGEAYLADRVGGGGVEEVEQLAPMGFHEAPVNIDPVDDAHVRPPPALDRGEMGR